MPMRFLITGGAGFIGSHLAESLLRQGHHVVVIDNLSTGRFENIAHLTSHTHFRFAIDTITNEVVMDRLVSECQVIFHLAAAVGVNLIVEKPVHTIETNVMGTEAVLRTALRYRVKVLIASTSEVYGKGNSTPFSEDDDVVLGPTYRSRWAYAASKMVDEFLALAYYREKGLQVVIFRLFNTVGSRQTGRYGMVIPRFVQQALRGGAIDGVWRWPTIPFFPPCPRCGGGADSAFRVSRSGGSSFQCGIVRRNNDSQPCPEGFAYRLHNELRTYQNAKR